MKKINWLLVLSFFSFSFISKGQPVGLNVGDVAPDFTAKNQNNKEVNLKEQLKTGSVVLIFYRGEWCPYCNQHLQQLQDSMGLITAKGANIIAVSPEKGENVIKTIKKTKATFNIVSDENSQILYAYKVAFELDEKTREKYKGYGVNLIERNGSNGNNLPVPAVYIINKEGKITYSYFDENFRKRASVMEIIKNL